MSNGRDPKISLRAPEELVEAMDDLADASGVQNRSAVWRMAASFALETNAEMLGTAARIDERRRDIIDKHRPVDLAEGLPGRVSDQMQERFKSGYSLMGLARKATSYVEEAQMYEEELDDVYREGELVDEVKREVRHALEAAELTNWWDRHANPYERFEGVKDGKERRRFALVVLQNAMRLDTELEALRSVAGDRRVKEQDLPELADEDLPLDLGREDVARVARELTDEGYTPEDIDPDAEDIDPFGWTDVEVASVTDSGDVALASADGGKGLPPVEVDASDETDETDEADELTEMVEAIAEMLRDLSHDHQPARSRAWNEDQEAKKRKRAEDRVETRLEAEDGRYMDTMTNYDLTPTDVIELAHEYNTAREEALMGERDELPTAVADDGGVRLD